ncbi:unnamed protein product, partial [Gulo gulo]
MSRAVVQEMPGAQLRPSRLSSCQQHSPAPTFTATGVPLNHTPPSKWPTRGAVLRSVLLL